MSLSERPCPPVWIQWITVAILGFSLLLTPPIKPLRTLIELNIEEIVTVLAKGKNRETLRAEILGPDYQFMQYLRRYTPEDAILLMTDQHAPSCLDPLKAKSQLWATYFLYPRRLIHLHQQDIQWFDEAEWLVIDGPAAVTWIAPGVRKPYDPNELRCIRFDMGWYLVELRAGRIAPEFAPPSTRIVMREGRESPGL